MAEEKQQAEKRNEAQRRDKAREAEIDKRAEAQSEKDAAGRKSLDTSLTKSEQEKRRTELSTSGSTEPKSDALIQLEAIARGEDPSTALLRARANSATSANAVPLNESLFTDVKRLEPPKYSSETRTITVAPPAYTAASTFRSSGATLFAREPSSFAANSTASDSSRLEQLQSSIDQADTALFFLQHSGVVSRDLALGALTLSDVQKFSKPVGIVSDGLTLAVDAPAAYRAYGVGDTATLIEKGGSVTSTVVPGTEAVGLYVGSGWRAGEQFAAGDYLAGAASMSKGITLGTTGVASYLLFKGGATGGEAADKATAIVGSTIDTAGERIGEKIYLANPEAWNW